MTVLAWDGKVLAADKRASTAGYGSTVTKIQRIHEELVGVSGDASAMTEFFAWARERFNPEKFPACQRTDDHVTALVIRSGRIFRYERSPYPFEVEDKFAAMGSGRDYALAAMYLGHNAVRAVEVACAMDMYCGNGVDWMELL